MNSDSSCHVESLVSCDGYDHYLLEVTKLEDHFLEGNVFEVVSWDMDNQPLEKELYCNVYMKWDGCCNVWFGDEDSYIHMCGVDSLKKHCQMMEELYRFAENNIKRFDEGEKWNS